MLLSIVMMVKNEEKYLDKTLNSLKNLMNDIESELIILDTGSTDNSINICKKYTEKVYFHEWNNNFGDMRNRSISYASGEWILILDADEELINYDKLSEFFNTDLHKKYNCASIELKNIFNEDESDYDLASLYRLFKNEEKFKYVGSIHEQPIYTEPAYNDVAKFKHYGYMYTNEEIRQVKNKRNLDILFKELKKNNNDPYINYQIGKSFISNGKLQDALYYLEKSCNLYKLEGLWPIYVYVDLIGLYIEMDEYIKCEILCKQYIKKDSYNFDVYYYLATSQMKLGNYLESISNYNKYLYYIKNYDLSTQSKSVYCFANTISNKEIAKSNIIYNYYKLNRYKDLMKVAKEIDSETLLNISNMIIVSLYKTGEEEEIVKLYYKFSETKQEIKSIRNGIEESIYQLKEEDKNKIYKLLSEIADNYGTLNKLRIGGDIDKEVAIEILKDENEIYFADILYYMLKDCHELEKLTIDLNYSKMQRFIDYIVLNRRDLILDLYDYLYNTPLTLDIRKLKVYSCLVRGLFLYGGLKGEKYENLFLMYINYRYEYIKSIYNQDFSDSDILEYIKDDEDRFIININIIYKNNDELEYIRKMKKLTLENKNYVNAIQILINKFQEEINEKDEMKKLKKQYKNIIENSINNGQLDEALKLIDEYKTISKEDIDIKNMQGIIHILKNEYKEAELILKEAFLMNSSDLNTIFNIAYLKEVKLENDEAIAYYKKIIGVSNEKQLVIEATNKIKELEKLAYTGVL